MKKKKKEFVQCEQIGEMVGSQNEKNGKEKRQGWGRVDCGRGWG